ncbi:hypothetical protein [Sulfuriroseicoccus oceanibius]|uniref:Uncharacterized protein n=1 Tax=Sulfuriroseicoccus oceanibius TaxID=2707525 RepID=A0A6B3L7T2_9BACT|nr:hypothetical protein [Sulfuriroseicoccus oceanibius]QQL46024.1 hypothetical protein G3M56_005440 [Sulfuriroseicoccus oceanibius]
MSTCSVQRITDLCGRAASVLTNGDVRVVVEDFGGMTPEFSYRNQHGYVNTHLIPAFRGTTCGFDPARHQDWGIKLVHELAGNFPCFPQFGNPSTKRGYEIPGCGHTAQLDWKVEKSGTRDGYCFVYSTMGGPETEHIHYEKFDILLDGHSVHYQVMRMRNDRGEDFDFGGAWHNTTGQPFIEKGCRISASADRYHTPVVSHDPDQREMLALNREFSSLKDAPTADGGSTDISVVPGMIGFTDFLTGRIPQTADLGWMSVVNPNQQSLYLTFFDGPASVAEGEFTFYFNHLWLQYGGRNYKPWASYDGGVDRVFAVGVESAISAWGYGLDYSDEHPVLMGNPTKLTLKAGETKTLYHGTLIGPVGSSALDEGIDSLERTDDSLVAMGKATTTFAADARFTRLRQIVAELDQKA